MARKRASMREGPLAELFRATEAAQRGQGEEQREPHTPDPPSEGVTAQEPPAEAQLPLEPEAPTIVREPTDPDATVEHVYDFEVGRAERQSTPAPSQQAAPPQERIRPAPTEPTQRPAEEDMAPVVELVPPPVEQPAARATRPEPVPDPVEPYTPPASRFVTPMPESA